MQAEHIARAEALSRMLAAATSHDGMGALDAVHVHHVATAIADILSAALDN